MTALEQVVLVVEDTNSNMMLCHDLLRACGCSVMQATDGHSGWQMAQEHRPNLIIMDIQLPGMSGLEVLARLKADKDLQAIPVIALTAFAMKGDEESFLQSGFDHYVSKPISVPDFLQMVKNFLGRNSSISMSCERNLVR
jgi:two-component system cell cycle response regulator DivK